MLPFPADALEWDAQGELVFRADASRRQREIISVGSGELRSLAPSWRKEKRYRIAQLSEAWRFQQTPFPECLRCKSMNGYPYCQRCEDEMNVEGVYRIWRAGMREEWGEESEDVLDVLFNKIKSLKDVFDRGVLPDYWFRLVQANSK